ncbi:lipocalin-like domain-containing protein [Bradyrhizobium sp. AUGA SZCCT0105]|nr:lipocalin-like domain-containing protein [Bradyrhizobium sp. AUGA SZCCT0105]
METHSLDHSDYRWRAHRTDGPGSERAGSFYAGRARRVHHYRGKSQAGDQRCGVGSPAQESSCLHRKVHNRGRQVYDQGHISWNELLTGQDQVRFFKLEGDKLSLRTAEQISAVYPGKKVVGTLEWERER